MLLGAIMGRVVRLCSRLAIIVAALALLGACGDGSDAGSPDVGSGGAEAAGGGSGDAGSAGAEPSREAVAGGVRLGGRFEWCGDVQGAWDRHEDALGAALAAVAAYNEAVAALDGATDELDRAEAIARVDAVERRATAAIDAYHMAASPSTSAATEVTFGDEVRHLNDGSEGTRGVAYGRALEAFGSVASPQQAALLAELPDILAGSFFERESVDRLLALRLPEAVRASIGVYAPLVAHRHADVPSVGAVVYAGHALRRAIGASEYASEVARAAGYAADFAIYRHLLDAELQAVADFLAAVDAYTAEAAKHTETVKLAHRAATTAASAEIGTGDYTADGDVAEVAYRAAMETLTDAHDALKGTRAVVVETGETSRDAVSDETRAAIDATADEGAAAYQADREATRYVVRDAGEAVHDETLDAIEGVIDAAKAAADETLTKDAPEAAAEAVRVSRGDGLASAVAAIAVLNRFEMGHFADTDTDGHYRIRRPAFVDFLVDAVAVETLLRGDPWKALQQSLAASCQ